MSFLLFVMPGATLLWQSPSEEFFATRALRRQGSRRVFFFIGTFYGQKKVTKYKIVPAERIVK